MNHKCRVLYSYLKPESVRTYPEATVRPWATVSVVGDALDFASALGYMYVSCRDISMAHLIAFNSKRNEIYKRGYVFRRGKLVIQMFQQEHVCPRL
jgi:mediator of RNA polymerase II transcription subunit 18